MSGLDSLMSVDLQHRLERSLGIQMSSAMLLQQASLAAVGDDACDLLASQGSKTRRPEPAGTEFALSEGQRALWLMEQLAGKASRGLLSRAIAVHGASRRARVHQRVAPARQAASGAAHDDWLEQWRADAMGA